MEEYINNYYAEHGKYPTDSAGRIMLPNNPDNDYLYEPDELEAMIDEQMFG